MVRLAHCGTGSQAHGLLACAGTNPIRPLFVATMPRFYFDIREGSLFTPDEEGTEFPDLDAAEREAAEAAAEIGRDRLPKGDARDVTIEVCNEHRERVVTVRITMEINRVETAPVAPAS